MGYSLYVFVEDCGKRKPFVNIQSPERELIDPSPDHESQVSPSKAKPIVDGYTSFGPIRYRNVDC